MILSAHSALSLEEVTDLTKGRDNSPAYFLEAVRKAGYSPLQRILYGHLKTRLVSLLMKQDKMTMAASLEVRVPFLDHRIVELAATMSDNLKIRSGESKYILKKVAEKLLPLDIVKRPKMGFPVPLTQWFREREDRISILLEKRTIARGLFDHKFVQRIIHEHRKGHHDFSSILWHLINLEHWIRVFIERDEVDLSPTSIAALQKNWIRAKGSGIGDQLLAKRSVPA
jgi:asparagine synthase (glutamine-hydrolysing)